MPINGMERKKPHQLQQKFKQVASARKVLLTVFWDCERILLKNIVPLGETINVVRYWDTLMKLHWAIQNKHRGKLSSEIVLFHDNAWLHTADLFFFF